MQITQVLSLKKHLLAIAAKHPFMAIGHIGIHKELAERGFENFDELFDLNYDDDRKDIRLNNALDLNWHNIIDPNWDVESALEKAERNFDFLINDYTRNIGATQYATASDSYEEKLLLSHRSISPVKLAIMASRLLKKLIRYLP